jgi:CRP-like cAMP-binding protein
MPRRAAIARTKKSTAGRHGKRRGATPGGTPLDRLGATRSYARNEAIFSRAQPSRHIYKVESGCVQVSFRDKERRLILGFYFPGDYFGLEMRKRHRVSADALTPSAIRVIGRRAIAAQRADPAIAKSMLDITHHELHRAQSHSMLLRSPAGERVASFLLAMKARNGSREVYLAMSRQDIADYLNLTIESVSRALTALQRKRKISIRGRRRVDVHVRRRLAA